jgi:hypothetical protein
MLKFDLPTRVGCSMSCKVCARIKYSSSPYRTATTRDVRRNGIAGTSAALDIRELQGGAIGEWIEHNHRGHEDCELKTRPSMVSILEFPTSPTRS